VAVGWLVVGTLGGPLLARRLYLGKVGKLGQPTYLMVPPACYTFGNSTWFYYGHALSIRSRLSTFFYDLPILIYTLGMPPTLPYVQYRWHCTYNQVPTGTLLM